MRSSFVDKKLSDVAAFVSGAGYLWVASATTDMVFRVDPTTTDVQKFPLRQSADVLVFGDGSVWVLDTLDGKIARVDPSKGQLGPSFLASGDLHGMAVGGGYLWVTDVSTNGIQRISEDLGSPPTRMPVGQVGGRPESVAYDDGAILVGFTGGTLAKINPSNPSSPATIWTQEVGFIDNGRPEHRVDGWRSARSSGSAVTALKRCDEELTPGETRSPELFPMSLGALPRAWAFRGHLLLNQRLGGEVTQLSESFDGTRRPRRIRRT